jgi:hypothetical protein
VITHIEEALENREDTLGNFQDIKGAFDNISFDIITKSAKWYGLADICWWSGSVLCGRKITAILAGGMLEVSVSRGHLQGDILSPLLWSLVVDELIGGLGENGCCSLGFADGIAILICGKFSEHCLGAYPAVRQSTKDGNSTIHMEVRFKGPEGTSPLWTYITVDY